MQDFYLFCIKKGEHIRALPRHVTPVSPTVFL